MKRTIGVKMGDGSWGTRRTERCYAFARCVVSTPERRAAEIAKCDATAARADRDAADFAALSGPEDAEGIFWMGRSQPATGHYGLGGYGYRRLEVVRRATALALKARTRRARLLRCEDGSVLDVVSFHRSAALALKACKAGDKVEFAWELRRVRGKGFEPIVDSFAPAADGSVRS